MTFFYEDQLYPDDDPFAVARSMGLNPFQAQMQLMGGGGGGGPDYDPNLLAEMVGQQYNPYQGYPTKQVSDQVWDVYGPMAEYLLPQMYKIQNPDAESFDLDAFFAAQPSLRGPLAEAYTEADGDTIKLYNYLQSNEPIESRNAQGEDVITPGFRDRFKKEVGRTEWEQLARQGYQPIIQAANRGATPEEIDEIAVDALMQQLEGVVAGGAPTSQRAISQLDFTREREGFRPAPGTGQPYPEYEGFGFGGGQPGIGNGGGTDPLADLARSPQYANIGGRDFEIPEDRVPGEGYGSPVFEGATGMLINRRTQPLPDYFRGGNRGQRARSRSRRNRQDANGGGGGGGRGFFQRGVYDFAQGRTPIQRFARWLNPL